MTAVAGFFNGLLEVVLALLITDGATALTPLQVVMWAGFVLAFIPFVIGVIRSLASRG